MNRPRVLADSDSGIGYNSALGFDSTRVSPAAARPARYAGNCDEHSLSQAAFLRSIQIAQLSKAMSESHMGHLSRFFLILSRIAFLND